MCSFKLLVVFVIFAYAYAEPPRRRNNFRTFARQEVADNGAPSDQPASEGYNYEPPAEPARLRLPTELQFTQFARQQEAQNSGYSYPKPTSAYGPPEEPTTQYGSPDENTESTEGEDTTESSNDTAADSQVETLRSLQATQFRRKNAKLTRHQKSQAIQLQPLVQPVYYVPYPTADLVEPQYVYVFK